MAVGERDPHTGYLTTGHEWNGIKELNTPVPRPVYFFLIVAALFSLAYWILMPAWPLGVTYTKGLLDIDQRTTVQDALNRADLEREVWTKRIASENYAAIQANPQLMTTVRQTGHTLFGDNCAACHGANAKGNTGYPNLLARSWLWGGDPEALAETIRIGINADHPNTRASEMLGFGRTQVLTRDQVNAVVAYVRGLSDETVRKQTPAQTTEAGSKVFAAQCVTCHGTDAKGMTNLGAPDLTDHNWIYGGDLQSVFTSVWNGRQGQMPAWESRLSAVERKILVLYLLDLQAQNK